MSGEFRREYDAGRMSVDTCNDIGWTTQWVWISVGLGSISVIIIFLDMIMTVLAVLLLFVVIMLTKRGLRRRGTAPVPTEETIQYREKEKYQAKSYYNNAFEIE